MTKNELLQDRLDSIEFAISDIKYFLRDLQFGPTFENQDRLEFCASEINSLVNDFSARANLNWNQERNSDNG